jgi:enediyne biosynthesis protein E4
VAQGFQARERRRERAEQQEAVRDMVGARVAVTRGDGLTLWRRARADGSYGSASDPRVLVGLGNSTAPVTVRVIWPDGRREDVKSVAIDRYTTLTEGDAH